MFKRIKIVLVTILIIIIALVSYAIYDLNNIPLKMTKNYNSIIISEDDVADYTIFLDPRGKYETLNQIDFEIRKEIANYMQSNNLKLKAGEQQFNRINATYNELITEDFKFIKINDN